MAIKYTNNENAVKFGQAMVFRGPVHSNAFFVNAAQEGVVGDNVDILNGKYDVTVQPSSLGSGVFINDTGRYLYSYQYGDGGRAIQEFTVFNLAGNTIYAGANVNSVSGWSIDEGFVIPSGHSYTFGSDNSDKIRNVWAMCNTGETSLTAGYATNQEGYSV